MRRSRPRSPRDVEAVDVLLVEDDDADERVAADHVRAVLHELAVESMAWRATWPGESRPLHDDDETPAPPRPGWARRVALRYRRRAVTAAVLALGVAATTGVVDARQTAARAAALAATPSVLADAAAPPAEAWRVRGRAATEHDDRLMVTDGASLRAVDPGTGEVTWTASAAAGRAASAGRCFAVDEGLRPGRAPLGGDTGPRGVVACVAESTGDAGDAGGAGGAGTGADAGGAAGAAEARTTLVVLDSATGRTRHTVTTVGALLLAEPVGRDLLVAAAEGGRVRVTRWDVATGTPRWDVVSPGPVAPDAGPVAPDGVAPVAQRRPDSVTVGSFAVDLSSGEALDAERESLQPYPSEEHALAGGARATWSWRPDGTSGRGVVSGGPSGRSVVLPGPPVRPTVTDGSDARVLVTRSTGGDRLRGLDLHTGRTRWSRLWPGASTLLATVQVEGVMLLDDGAAVTALDVGTGDVRWRTPVDPGAAGAAVTDGDVVVLPVRAYGGALLLVASRIADGTEVWRTRAPAGTVSLRVVDHTLVAVTADEVVGLR
ncbi:outer membrane protein assembly factor BamB family protein [Cellulomonas aerilata]|uniref:Pyrrolo-quinoline quinone repeat domain-containing protein n=1 Tax=Cellulomonas aerilata TaxID=515326 RepID=A0A512DAV3_9CELL|nr:PQQ-binding-like beta-propeller repeat protein [Cellulomonas aerilata]GEO33609.1 hypothetical protein CAE01nite_13340 [Cellulomonas aerilata]